MIMAKLTITVVTDPMMGLLWETWPVLRKLETHFDQQIGFKFMMGQLVKDVYDLVDANIVRMYGKRVALNQYWTKLMQIYLQEESISGMPIYMGGGQRLFDESHTSSIALNAGLLAIEKHNEKLADQILYEMQYDTVVEDRQTNSIEYLTKLAEKFNLQGAQFEKYYNSDEVKQTLAKGQQILKQMKIDQLPAYLITYNAKTYIVKGLPKYSEWLDLIDQVTGGELKAQAVAFNLETVNKLIVRHPHISSLELKAAFDIDNEQKITELLKDSGLEKKKIKATIFYKLI